MGMIELNPLVFKPSRASRNTYDGRNRPLFTLTDELLGTGFIDIWTNLRDRKDLRLSNLAVETRLQAFRLISKEFRPMSGERALLEGAETLRLGPWIAVATGYTDKAYYYGFSSTDDHAVFRLCEEWL